MSENGFVIVSRRAVQATAVVSLVSLAWFASVHPEFLAFREGFISASQAWARNWAGWDKFSTASWGHLRAVVTALAVLAAAWMGGSRILAWIGQKGGVDSSVGAGLGLTALAVFGLGMTGILFKPVLAALMAALLIFGWGSARVRRPVLEGPAWLWAAAGILLLLDLFASLSTEFFHDSLVYHLALPELFLSVHRFPVIPGNMLNFLPLNAEMLYLPALAFGGEEGAKLLNFGMGVLAVAALASVAKHIGGNRAGWAGGVAAFLAVSMPVTAVENEISFADNARALWEVLALGWFIASRSRNGKLLSRSALAVSAVFAGLAMGAKYLSFIGAGILAAVLFIEVAKRLAWRWGRALHAPVFFIAVSLVVASPWLVRNALATRDPVYPFGRKIFHSLRWSAFEQSRWMADNRYYGVRDMTFLRWLALPVRMPLDRVEGEFGTFTTGPLLLGLALLLILVRPWPWTARVVLAVFLGEALVWSLTSHLVRYLYPALLFFCALLGWAVAQARARAGRSYMLIALVMAVWAGCAFTHRVHHRVNMDENFGLWGSFTGRITRTDVLSGRGFGARLEALPAGKVLLVGEERALGIGRVWEGSSMYNMPVLEWWVRESSDARRLSIRAKQAGIRSVLLNGDGFGHLKSRGDFNLSAQRMGILNNWWKTLGVVFRAPPVTAYAVPPFKGHPGVK